MPGDDIDRAAFAVDRERDLGLDDPIGQAGQSPDKGLDHSGMARIDESVEIAATPAGDEIDPRVQGVEYPAQDDECRGVDAAVLEA